MPRPEEALVKAERLRELGELKRRAAMIEAELALTPPRALPELGDKAELAMYRLVAEFGNDMISIHAANGDYVFASPSAERLFGWKPEELLGQSAYTLFHADDLVAISSDHAAHDSGAPRRLRYRLRCKDGLHRWVETRSQSKRTNGSVEYIVCITRDVDDEVVAQGRAEAALDLLRRNERAALVGNTVGVFNHELTNPLAGAMLALELVQVSDERSRAGLHDARRSLARMRNALAGMALILAVRSDEPRAIDLATIAARLSNLFDGQDLRLVRDLAPAPVVADTARVHQCLHNVLAAHAYGAFHETSGGALVMRIATRLDHDWAVFEVDSPCEKPLASIQGNVLSLLEGDADPLGNVPMAIAAQLAGAEGGRLENVEHAAGTSTRVLLRRARG